LWLNEIVQPPPDPEANRWIQVTRWQMAVCDGDACAAAILAYFFARHHGKLKHADDGREDNQIAVAHGLKPRRAAESLWFRATDAQIEEAIFFYRRRKFTDAIAKLETLGFVSILRKNPNPNFAADNSRYFKLNPDVVQVRLRALYDYKSAVTPSAGSPRKNADTPSDPKNSVRKNAETPRRNAETIGKNAESLNKEVNTERNNEGGSPSGSPSGVDSKDESTPVVGRDEKLRLKNILEGTAPLEAAEGVEPDEALLALMPVALECSRAAQGLFAFTFWKLHRKHPRAIYDAKRKRIVEERLKAGYTLDRIILAVRGIQFSVHHMGENDRKMIYDDFGAHVLKDGKQVETFEALALEYAEADRSRRAESALRSDLPAVPESRFSDSELEEFATNVADMLASGYLVEHLRAKFNVGKTISLQEWTRILERAAAIKRERESGSMNGNGKATAAGVVRAADSPEWSGASDAARESGAGPRAMPDARKEDFE
jgi:hypothetical protein